MPPFKDLTGQRFGKLSVIKRDGNLCPTKWICKCDCGSICSIRVDRLIDGSAKSCGCYQREIAKKSKYKHGMAKTKIYDIWSAMKSRCSNPNFKEYSNYGGRGITVCDEWRYSFEKFRDWSIENGYKEGLTIDRIDVNGNYCPENCRWATRYEQNRNKRDNRFLTLNGRKMVLKDWSIELGIKYSTLSNRISSGWTDEEVLTIPVGCGKTISTIRKESTKELVSDISSKTDSTN